MCKFCPSVHKILQTLQMTLCRILQLMTTKGFPVVLKNTDRIKIKGNKGNMDIFLSEITEMTKSILCSIQIY